MTQYKNREGHIIRKVLNRTNSGIDITDIVLNHSYSQKTYVCTPSFLQDSPDILRKELPEGLFFFRYLTSFLEPLK